MYGTIESGCITGKRHSLLELSVVNVQIELKETLSVLSGLSLDIPHPCVCVCISSVSNQTYRSLCNI